VGKRRKLNVVSYIARDVAKEPMRLAQIASCISRLAPQEIRKISSRSGSEGMKKRQHHNRAAAAGICGRTAVLVGVG